MATAHAILAARGEWVVNEKRLLARAGLRDIDAIVGQSRANPESLARQIAAVRHVLAAAS